jgi:hypothetical protein
MSWSRVASPLVTFDHRYADPAHGEKNLSEEVFGIGFSYVAVGGYRVKRTTSKTSTKRVKPSTLSEVVELAKRADKLSADSRWWSRAAERDTLESHIGDLDMAIIFLAKRPEKSLVRRLARAESERLRGSLLVFERKLKTLKSRNGAKAASEDLNTALSTFIVMADGLN